MGKKQIHIQMDRELYKKFAKRLIDDEIDMTTKLNELVTDFLK